MTTLLDALVVDDEEPAREELAFLLRADPRIGSVVTAGSATEALRALEPGDVDVLFLDIRMPGLDGIELARVVSRFADPPAVVFVTAYDDSAVEAFDLRAVDYVLKPVRRERLAEAVRRVQESLRGGAAGGTTRPDPTRSASGAAAPTDTETIAVELAGVTRFVPRSEVRYAEAHGDYARLHTPTGSHLVRIPLSTLEERWRTAGFLRVHRQYLVALHHIEELRLDAGRVTVRVGGTTLPVSRRHARELRDVLVPGRPP